jgi:hypothetical protein
MAGNGTRPRSKPTHGHCNAHTRRGWNTTFLYGGSDIDVSMLAWLHPWETTVVFWDTFYAMDPSVFEPWLEKHGNSLRMSHRTTTQSVRPLDPGNQTALRLIHDLLLRRLEDEPSISAVAANSLLHFNFVIDSVQRKLRVFYKPRLDGKYMHDLRRSPFPGVSFDSVTTVACAGASPLCALLGSVLRRKTGQTVHLRILMGSVEMKDSVLNRRLEADLIGARCVGKVYMEEKVYGQGLVHVARLAGSDSLAERCLVCHVPRNFSLSHIRFPSEPKSIWPKGDVPALQLGGALLAAAVCFLAGFGAGRSRRPPH